jgi:hypothetical protein
VFFGCALGAVGSFLWASKAVHLDFSAQIWPIVLAPAGIGLMLTPASTDAVNRASRLSCGEATGITQTVRSYSASLGLAIVGALQVCRFRSTVQSSLVQMGVPSARASAEASAIAQFQSSGRTKTSSLGTIPHFVWLDFAESSRSVFLAMGVITAGAAVVALVGLRPGVQRDTPAEDRTLAPVADEPVVARP